MRCSNVRLNIVDGTSISIVEALRILKMYNEWQRGSDIRQKLMSDAIDTILSHFYTERTTLAYAVIPDAERLDIGENSAVAVFKYRKHAEEFAARMWGEYCLIEEKCWRSHLL